MSRTPQKRQRALTPRGRATRQKIIEAAAALVYAAGAARLNLDEVMAASRTSKSQLYHYFTDKEALIQEVIAFQTKRVLTVNSDHLDAINSFQALRRWRDDLVDRNRAVGGFGGCPIGSLADELANHSPPSRKRLANSFETWASRIENALRNMKAKGLPQSVCRTKGAFPRGARGHPGRVVARQGEPHVTAAGNRFRHGPRSRRALRDMTAEGSYARGWSGSCRANEFLGRHCERQRSNPVLRRRSGLLRRRACHRAGHFGPDPLALLAMTSGARAARTFLIRHCRA